MKQDINRVLHVHRPHFDYSEHVWACNNYLCHCRGTLEHVVEHQADEIMKVVADARVSR